MKTGVVQASGYAVKSYADASRFDGEEVVRRAVVLRDAGVSTPPATYDPVAKAVRFPWIAGQTAREQFGAAGPASSPAELIERTHLLAATLAALAKLHKIDPAVLDIETFNPWRLIYLRLVEARIGVRPISPMVCRCAERCCTILRDVIADLDPEPRTIVHGDFHLGQIVVGRQTGDAWVVDLDDLCLGPPESDLGNFAAHIVSSADLYTGDLETGFCQLVTWLCGIYDSCTDTIVDPHKIFAYGAVALARRALKLSEGGRADEAGLAMLELAQRLPFRCLQ